ncbi:MAG: glutaredoxin domain-containing protein [Armatimonadota bacterium]
MGEAVIYTSNNCPACVMAKDFFSTRNIPYKEYNISLDRIARDKVFEITNQTGVPVIEYKGETLVGFRPRTLEKLVNSPL